MKKKIFFGIIVTFGIMIGLLFNNQVMTYHSIKKTTNQFFDHIVENDLEGAFHYLAYYDEAYDLEPRMDADQAERIWIGRIEELQEKNIQVKGIENLVIRFNDTYPRGTATVTFHENGKEIKQKVNINFINRNGWMVGSIQFVNQDLNDSHPLAIALSGFVK